jgi:hypothetical protein
MTTAVKFLDAVHALAAAGGDARSATPPGPVPPDRWLERLAPPLGDDEIEHWTRLAETGEFLAALDTPGGREIPRRLLDEVRRCRAILKNLSPRDVVAAAARAGVGVPGTEDEGDR